MPLYAYVCDECGVREDTRVPADYRNDWSPVCRDCTQGMRRVITAPSLSFVGLDFTRGYVPAGKETY